MSSITGLAGQGGLVGAIQRRSAAAAAAQQATGQQYQRAALPRDPGLGTYTSRVRGRGRPFEAERTARVAQPGEIPGQSPADRQAARQAAQAAAARAPVRTPREAGLAQAPTFGTAPRRTVDTGIALGEQAARQDRRRLTAGPGLRALGRGLRRAGAGLGRMATNANAMAGAASAATAALLIFGQMMQKQAVEAAKTAGIQNDVNALRKAEVKATKGWVLAKAGLGAGAGAAIGTLIAPGIGTAIGAALGGVTGGLIGALTDNTKEVRAAFRAGRVEQTTELLTDSLKRVLTDRATPGGAATAGIGQAIEAQMDAITEATLDGRREEADSIRKGLKGQLSQFEALRQKLIESSASVEELGRAGRGAGNILLRQIAFQTNRSFAELQRETAELIRQHQEAAAAAQQVSISLGVLADTAQATQIFAGAVSDLEQQTKRAADTAGIFAGLGAGRASVPDFKGILGARAFERAATGQITEQQDPQLRLAIRQLLGTGEAAQRLEGEVLAIAQLTRELPAVLRDLANAPQLGTEQDLTRQFSDAITEKFPQVGDELLVVMTDSLRQIQREGGPPALIRRIRADARKVGNELIGGRANFLKDLDKVQQSFNNVVKTISQLQSQVFDSEKRITDARIQGSKIALANEIALRKARQIEDPLPLDRRVGAIREQQAQRVAFTGLTGDQAQDPQALSRAIQGITAQILEARRRLFDASIQSPEGIQQAQVELGRLVNTSAVLRQALQNLATSTEEFAAVQDELSRLQSERQARQDFVVDYFGSTRQQQVEITRTLAQTFVAGTRNSFDTFTEQQRIAIIRFVKTLRQGERIAALQDRTSREFLRDVIGGTTFYEWRSHPAGVERLVCSTV